MNEYDYCSKCGKLFDYLDLRLYEFKLYCKKCYEESTGEELQELVVG